MPFITNRLDQKYKCFNILNFLILISYAWLKYKKRILFSAFNSSSKLRYLFLAWKFLNKLLAKLIVTYKTTLHSTLILIVALKCLIRYVASYVWTLTYAVRKIRILAIIDIYLRIVTTIVMYKRTISCISRINRTVAWVPGRKRTVALKVLINRVNEASKMISVRSELVIRIAFFFININNFVLFTIVLITLTVNRVRLVLAGFCQFNSTNSNFVVKRLTL